MCAGWTRAFGGKPVCPSLFLAFACSSPVAMPPVLQSASGRHTVIRPMVYVWEQEVIAYAKERKFPVVCCC